MIEKDLLDIIKREVEKYLEKTEVKKEKIKLIGQDKILKEHIEKNFEISNESKKIIVTSLNIKETVDLANGTFSTENGEEILNHILKGHEIFIINQGVLWKNYRNIPERLYEKYSEYESILREYGVVFVDKLEIEYLLDKNNKILTFNEKVLNLRSIKKIKEKEIVISGKTIITQLAMDYIRENNIKVIKRG